MPNPHAGASVPNAKSSPLAVLLIDDDPGICSSLSRILRADGYRVDIARSANEAIDRDHWSDYFAILVDRRLPDRSADDLLPEIIARAPDASVLVITGYADLDSSLKAIRAGAADYLLKPVDPDELRMRLKRLADLRQARDEIRRRDLQLRFMIEHLPTGAAYIENSTGRMQINKTTERITGYSADELTDRDAWFRCVFGEAEDVHRRIYEEDRAGGFLESRILRITTREGRRILVEFSGYCSDEHEVWLIHDVTERLRDQEELRQQRDFSDRLLETAQVIILVMDSKGDIVRINQFMQELSGYSLDEVRGKSWFETFIPFEERSRIQKLYLRVLEGEQVRGHVNPIQTRDQRLRQIAWWAKPLTDARGNVTEVLSIGHDVTSLKDVEAKLVQSERLAAIGQMIAGLAHESRNALQRARACLDILSLDLSEQPQQLGLTQRIQSALDELQRLYEEVRSYAAPIKLSCGRCTLSDVWQTAWQHVIQPYDEAPVSLYQTQGSDHAATECVVDRDRLEQVFRNVLENAVAVSPRGGRVTLSCEQCELEGHPALHLTIIDQGPGLTAEQQQRIFEPFYTTKQKGTGLGMPISHRIIDAHAGLITAANHPEGGTAIEIVIPRSQE